MRSRFSALSDEAVVFRLAKEGGGHLPAGHVLPKRDWLEPNKEDKEEAKTTGREPGISVWERDQTTTSQAWAHRGVVDLGPQHRAFRVVAGECGRLAKKWEREGVQVVADPIEPRDATWKEGHSLAEGLGRPSGVDRQRHWDFLDELIMKFEPHA